MAMQQQPCTHVHAVIWNNRTTKWKKYKKKESTFLTPCRNNSIQFSAPETEWTDVTLNPQVQM